MTFVVPEITKIAKKSSANIWGQISLSSRDQIHKPIRYPLTSSSLESNFFFRKLKAAFSPKETMAKNPSLRSFGGAMFEASRRWRHHTTLPSLVQAHLLWGVLEMASNTFQLSLYSPGLKIHLIYQIFLIFYLKFFFIFMFNFLIFPDFLCIS